MSQSNPSLAESLHDWLPVELHFRRGQPSVEWCHFQGARLDQPFYIESVHRALSHPFNHLFRRNTPLDTLELLLEERPFLQPSGIIFHLSRCGSTLMGQALNSLPDSIVLSEPEPFDATLRAPSFMPSLRDEERVEWMRLMVGAMGHPRFGEKQLFLKTYLWHMLEWRLIEQAFPGVPWVFLYRDPVEILVSHQRSPSSQTLESLFNDEESQKSLASSSFEEHSARVLARVCEAALDAIANRDNLHLLNYTQLPNALWDELPFLFGLTFSESDKERMKQVATRNAKVPTVNFAPDSSHKQNEASAAVRNAAEEHVAGLYKQLEAVRLQNLNRESS